MKRVQILTSHYPPENTAGAQRVYSLVKNLSKEFHLEIVSLVQKGKPISSSPELDEPSPSWVSQGNFSGSNFLVRGIFELWYSLKLIWTAKNEPADLRIISIPYMFLLPLGVLFFHRTPLIADVRDLVWEYLDEKTVLQRLFKRILAKLMLFSLRRCAAVVVTTPAERSFLSKELSSKKLFLISNGISRDRFYSISEISPPPFSGTLNLMVCGNVGKALDLEVLLRAVEGLGFVHVRVVGGGNELERLIRIQKSRKLENITFEGEVPFDSLRSYYSGSHLLFLQVHPRYSTSRPVRLYEYLATGLPILFAGTGQTLSFLKEFENIQTVEPSSPDCLREALISFTKKDKRASPENPRKVFGRFLREDLNKNYEALIKEILAPSLLREPLADSG